MSARDPRDDFTFSLSGAHPANECGDPYDCPEHGGQFRAAGARESGKVEVTAAKCGCGQVIYDLITRDGVAVKVADHPLSNPYEFEDIGLVCPHGVRWYAIPTGQQVAIWRAELGVS